MYKEFIFLHNQNLSLQFPCDESGKVDESALSSQELENYRYCLTGQIPILEGDIWEEQYINGEIKWIPSLGGQYLVPIQEVK